MYNMERPHRELNKMIPIAFELQLNEKKKKDVQGKEQPNKLKLSLTDQ